MKGSSMFLACTIINSVHFGSVLGATQINGTSSLAHIFQINNKCIEIQTKMLKI